MPPLPRHSSSTITLATLERGVRLVAIFEIFKGILALLVAAGLLSITEADIPALLEHGASLLQGSLASYYSRHIMTTATHISTVQIQLAAGFALLYTSIRFIEAYGLWLMRAWGKWLAIISSAIYIPFEIYELTTHSSTLTLAILLINIFIVSYLLYVQLYSHNNETRSLAQVDYT